MHWITLGWKNLRCAPLRLLIAILGVMFAVVLVLIEVGMLLGLTRNASLLIDQSKADLWVSAPHVKTFEFATPISRRKKFMVQSVPGVDVVEEFNISVTAWKLPDGGIANCQSVAFEVRGQLAPPVLLTKGNLKSLINQNAVVVDEGSLSMLGSPKIGDRVEIIDTRARVVGISTGLQSFSTMPYIFSALECGYKYGLATRTTAGPSSPEGRKSIYLLVKVKEGFDVAAVQQAISKSVSGIEVHTREGFSWRTRRYWIIETGIGFGFLVAAILGMVVGAVIVSQTLYGLTMDKLSEFGVLRALGAGMTEICGVVLGQAFICGFIGLVAGVSFSLGVSRAASSGPVAIELPALLIALVSGFAIVLCAFASLLSILKLRRIEPAIVFRT